MAGKTSQFPVGPAWIPWASQEVQRPVQDMPSSILCYFDLNHLKIAENKNMDNDEINKIFIE